MAYFVDREATAPDVRVKGDKNLLGNAWKYSAKATSAVIEFGVLTMDSKTTYFIRDNDAGFDLKYGDKLFKPFSRLHGDEEFEGTGIGLATVSRIIEHHSGRAWAEGVPGEGATFYSS